MKTIGFAVIAGSFFVFAQGDELQKEQAALQGKWKITRLENSRGVDENFAGATLEFLKDGKGLEFVKGDDRKKGSYTINPAGKPKEITVTPGNDPKMEGIYQLEKDSLKICVAENSAQDGRPTEFAVKDGKSFIFITLERVKAK